MKLQQSFGAKMILSLSILVLVVCIGLGVTAYFLAQDAVVAEVDQAIELLSAADAHRLAGLIEQRLAVMQELTMRREVQSLNIHRQLEALAGDVERLGFLDLAIVDASGTARYVHSDPAQLGDRGYVRLARTGQPNVSDVIVSRVTGSLVVMFAVPITVDNRVEQVLIGRVDGTAIQELVAGMGFGAQGYAYVLSENGTIIAHPNLDYVMDQRNVLDPNEPDFAELRTAMAGLQNNRGIMRYDLGGDMRIVGSQPVPGTNWTIGIGAHEDDVLRGLYTMRTWLLGIALVFLVIGILAAAKIGSGVAKPLRQATVLTERLADGDLRVDDSQANNRQDEIGRLLASVKKVTGNLHEVMAVITSQVQQASDSSQQLSAASEENSATIEEVASSVNEFARNVQQVTEYTEEMQAGANTMQSMTEQGAQQMQVSRDSYQRIVRSSEESKQQIEGLATLTKDIEQVISLIAGIADQTNLLALNAAIEAARAGESGRGFAVVADEVRSLAEETQKSIGSIEKTMEQLRQGVRQTVQTMDQNSKAVQDGMASIDGIGKFLEDTSAEIRREVELIQNVANAMTELDQGSQELSSAAEEQAASMAEVANAADAMASLAKDLETAAGQFRLS